MPAILRLKAKTLRLNTIVFINLNKIDSIRFYVTEKMQRPDSKKEGQYAMVGADLPQ